MEGGLLLGTRLWTVALELLSLVWALHRAAAAYPICSRPTPDPITADTRTGRSGLRSDGRAVAEFVCRLPRRRAAFNRGVTEPRSSMPASEPPMWQLVVIPRHRGDRWRIDGRYVEVVWAEVLGPVATAVAHRLGFVMARAGGCDANVTMGALSAIAAGESGGQTLEVHGRGLRRARGFRAASARAGC